MIRGAWRGKAEQADLSELRNVGAFRRLIDKLRSLEVKATSELIYASPQDVQLRQGYARALSELINELTSERPTGG